jgi:DNA-3-methyladenine glycosylase II
LATIMRDHPAWTTTGPGATRAMRSGASTWLIAVDDLLADIEMSVVDGPPDGPAPEVVQVDEPILLESDIGSALASLLPLTRVRNPNLWDAIATAILSKIVTADQARAMYRRFCAAYGDPVETPHGADNLFPDAERVQRLPAKAFSGQKMSFTRVPLRAAARAYLEHGTAWSQLEPAALVTALRSVPGIGSWTAGTAVADFSGDFSIYPFPDRAIRTYLHQTAPATDWPCREAQLRTLWRAIAGDNVSGLTQLVLAWEKPIGYRPAATSPTSRPLGYLPEPVDLLNVLET